MNIENEFEIKEEQFDEYIDYLENLEFERRMDEYKLMEEFEIEMEKSGKGIRNIQLGE